MTIDHRPKVIIVGLGPAGPGHLTTAARTAIETSPVTFVRTMRHLAAKALVLGGARSLDHHYEQAASFADTYRGIVEEVIAEAQISGVVAYCVPGSPFVCEDTVSLLRADDRITCEVIPGLSFLDLCWDRLGIDPVKSHIQLVDAQSFAVDAAGKSGPFLVAQLHSRGVASDLKLSFEEAPTKIVTILHHLGHDDEQMIEVPFEDLDRSLELDHLSCCFIPALAHPVASALVEAVEIVATLRQLCPWDKEQTHRSLARHLIEETYEAVEAIDELGDDLSPELAEHLEEELGDVLCQVLFHSTIAEEEGLFSLSDVARTLVAKLVRRHPHVFGDATLTTADSVVARWEQIKQDEKGRTSLMDGIPKALPALSYVTKIERKAVGVGFGYEASPDRVRSVADELLALEGGDEEAFGEVLFSLARFAAATGVDPEAALRVAARRFQDRFVATELAASAAGETFSDLTPEQRHVYWDQVEPAP